MLAKVYKRNCSQYYTKTVWLVICLEANYAIHCETEQEADKIKKIIENRVKELKIEAYPKMDDIINEEV